MTGDARGLRIVVDDLRGPEIAALLAYHLAEMHRHSPPESVHALDIARLRVPEVTFWTAWDGAALAGCAALRAFAPGLGEVKSMRTAPTHLRRGVAAALLDTLIATARARGMTRLHLETGTGPAFAAPLALYARAGFVAGPRFSDYADDGFLHFMQLDL